MTVTASDISAAVDKSYSIQGTGGHDHTVTVTAANFNTLRETGSVSVTSIATAGHDHVVTITCA